MSTPPAEERASESTRRDDRTARAALRRGLAGDLDNIILKALRKEPSRRYASVEQLANDIHRQLDGLPVLATPDSVSYRVNKFIHRHKVGVAATIVIVFAVTSGLATTLWEERVAVQERTRAQRRFNDVRKLANSFLFEFDDAIRNLPGSTPARSLVVMRALEYLDGLAQEARTDRSLQLEIAAAYQKVGEVQGDPMFPNLGDSKGALQSLQKALAILKTLSLAEPNDQQVLLTLAGSHQGISDVLDFSGDTAGAVEHSGEALKIYESLADKRASDTAFLTDWITQSYHYANLLKSVGALDKAAAEYGRAIELCGRLSAAQPSNPEVKFHLATSLDGLGNVLSEKGNTSAALENRRQGLAIREELVRLEPNNAHYRRQLAFSHHNVGLSLIEVGDLPAAIAQFRQELGLFEALGAADPKDVQGQRNRSLAHKQLGDALMRMNNVHGALVQYRASLDIDRALASADPGNSQSILDLSFSEGKMGAALGKLGHTPEALVILRSGIAKQEGLAAKDPTHILLYNHLANSYMRLANCLRDSGDTKTAVGYFRKAVAERLALAEKSPGSSSNRRALAESYSSLASALERIQRDEAVKEYNNAFALLEALSGADQNNTQYRIAMADILSNTARLYVRLARQTSDPPRRQQAWTKAKLLYQRSDELWLGLDRIGKIPPNRSGAIREVSDELARCDDSLTRLADAH